MGLEKLEKFVLVLFSLLALLFFLLDPSLRFVLVEALLLF